MEIFMEEGLSVRIGGTPCCRRRCCYWGRIRRRRTVCCRRQLHYQVSDLLHIINEDSAPCRHLRSDEWRGNREFNGISREGKRESSYGFPHSCCVSSRDSRPCVSIFRAVTRGPLSGHYYAHLHIYRRSFLSRHNSMLDPPAHYRWLWMFTVASRVISDWSASRLKWPVEAGEGGWRIGGTWL